jgi:hypothetical protein
VSTGELARAAGVGLSLARRELGALVTRGELQRTGRGRAVRYDMGRTVTNWRVRALVG